MHDIQLSTIIDKLWCWFMAEKDRPAIRDTTKVNSVKYDCCIESSISSPMSFTIFELSDKGELLVDDVSKLMDSKAVYFLFVNTNKNFMVMVKNTLENCKKLAQGEKVENMKVRVVS